MGTSNHCGAPLVPANTVSTIPVSLLSIPSDSTSSIPNECSSTLRDPLQLGLNSVESRSFHGPSALESEVLDFMMDNIMVCPVSTIAHVPRSVRPLLARVLSIELRKACSSIWGFVRLSMFAKLVLRTPSTSRSQRRRFVISSILLDRLHLWNQSGGISLLWASLQDDLRVCKHKKGSDSSFCKSRALFWAREGRYSNALQSLSSQGIAGFDDDSAYKDLLARHPSSPCPDSGAKSTVPALTVDESMVLTCLRAFPKGTSPGASKLRAQHLLDAITGTTAPASRDCLLSLTCLMNHLLSGNAPPCLAPWVCGAPLTALLKKGGGVRPIAVGEVIRRLTSRLCCLAVRPSLPGVFIPYGQVGVGIPGGLETAIHVTRRYISQHSSDTSLGLLKIDMKNAFNECSRSAFFDRIVDDFPEISAWVKWCYCQPAELRFGSRRILASSGVQQGDPLGPLLFSLVLLQFIDFVKLHDIVKLHLWYLDDGTFIGSKNSLLQLLESFSLHGPQFGLHLNLSKCEVFWPSGDSFPEFPTNIKRVSDGLELLGSPIWGTTAYFDQFLSARLSKVAAAQDSIAILEDPQVELHLLRSCLGSCKVIHLLRTVPLNVLRSFLEHFDANLRNCLSRILQCSLPDDSWRQASLPFRLGGLGLRSSYHSASAAFIGSCNSIRLLASQLLSQDFDDITFPAEDQAVALFSECSSATIDPCAKQCDLQAVLDHHFYDDLLASANIRDQARLTALSHSSGTCSGWLKAIPQSSLGLAINGPEFVVGLRLWLGIPLFPIPPLCVCLAPIDCFGDHLLECSHGPMRIRRHDALVDIVHHALSQSHPGVLKEQRASSENQSRPGDVYHPNFQYGRPAFFDISVRSTTQPSYISSASTCAGVAAAAGELAKDLRHQVAVEETGCDFIPLVVETFGVWSPFALRTLRTIAERTTARSGASAKLARTHLLQQLSVSLWTNNARMILRYWALQGEDSDFPFVKQQF